MKKNYCLGKLEETYDGWKREALVELTDFFIESYENENNCVFQVIEQYPTCKWGFFKKKTLEELESDNGKAIYFSRKWTGQELGILFENGSIIPYDIEECLGKMPIQTCFEGRCKGIVEYQRENKTGRCEKRKYNGDFCATCAKYEQKKKEGKLRNCKYCDSTYHSTRSCIQNPKVIEEEERFQRILRESRL